MQCVLCPIYAFLPICTARALSVPQVIQVETSPGCVESCQLNQVEQVASVESARLAAMHHCGPIHTFMFSKDGDLLMANKRGLDRYREISKSLLCSRLCEFCTAAPPQMPRCVCTQCSSQGDKGDTVLGHTVYNHMTGKLLCVTSWLH